MSRGRRILLYFIPIAILAVVLVFWTLAGRESKQAAEEVRLPVRVVTPLQGDVIRSLELSGRIESENQLSISPRISGRLDSLLVEVGDKVEAGSVLGQIDPAQYQFSLSQAESAYRAAESTFRRMENLYSAGATSEENFSGAQVQYQAMKSQYELALLQYNYTSIQTPVSGSVLVKHLNSGSLVSPSVPVYTIGSLDSLKASIQVPEEFYTYFTGDSSRISVDIRHASLRQVEAEGQIISVAPYVSPQSRNFEVIVRVNEPEQFRPGMLVYVSFELEKRENVYFLPQGLVGAGSMYWRVNSEGNAVSMENPQLFETDELVQVPDTWSEYKLVSQGQYFLSEGQQVEILAGSAQ